MVNRILFLLILCLLFAATLDAQQPAVGLADVRQTITHLQQQLEFLKELNKQFPDERLEELIGRIEIHIRKAVQAVQNNRKKLAQQEAYAARRLIDVGMRSVLAGPIVSLREQLEEKLRRAEELLRKHFRPDAQKLLQQAQKSKNQAETAIHNRNVAKAVELYRVALFNVNKVLDLLSAGGGTSLAQIFNEEKANFEQLLRRVQNIISHDRTSIVRSKETNFCQELYNQALGQRKEAESAYSRGNIQIAIEHFRWGTRLLLRAIDICGSALAGMTDVAGVNLEQLAREELNNTLELLRSVERSIESARQSRQYRLYSQAQKVYSDAMRSSQAGDYSQAIQKAKLAQTILERVRQIPDRREGKASTRLEHEIELLRDLISSLGDRLNEKDNPRAARLLDLARQYLNRGERAHQNGRVAVAAASLYAATRFALTAKSALSRDRGYENLKQEALSSFASFEQKRSDLAVLFSGDPDAYSRAWLTLVDDIYQAAVKAEASGQYLVLLENSRVGIQLLERIEKHLADIGS
jgi:hypothetical protein